MPSHRSIEFYEQILNKSILGALRSNPLTALALGISQEIITNAVSSNEVLTIPALSEKAVDILVLSAIQSLIEEYLCNTGVTSHSFLNMYGRNTNNMREKLADEVRRTANNSLILTIQDSSFQPCIDDIKRALSEGVLDPNISPMDNFPNIVRAIVNLTRDIPRWTLDQAVTDRLSTMQIKENGKWGQVLI